MLHQPPTKQTGGNPRYPSPFSGPVPCTTAPLVDLHVMFKTIRIPSSTDWAESEKTMHLKEKTLNKKTLKTMVSLIASVPTCFFLTSIHWKANLLIKSLNVCLHYTSLFLLFVTS